MSSKRVIIWLEDMPQNNEQVKEILSNCEYELILCTNLKDFKAQITMQSLNSVAGFILDILITEKNLADLGMPMVLTTNGNDTGVAVLRNYLRDVESDLPVRVSWKQCPVLMLTSLNEMYINSRYSSIIESEKNYGDHTTWLTKTDEEGSKEESIKKIKTWIRSL
jgi:CheY-like chemotaxis protein